MKCIVCPRVLWVGVLAAGLALSGPVWSQGNEELPVQIPSIKASSNPCLKYLPKDWWLAGNLDVKAMMEFLQSGAPGTNAPSPMSGMMQQYIAMIQALTGINIEEQVKYATFFVAGDPPSNPSFLLVVKGSFSNETAEARLATLAAGQMKKRVYGEHGVWEGDDVGFSFPEDSTLAVGSSSLLKRALATEVAKGARLPDELKSVLDRTKGDSIVWLALRPQPVMGLEEFASFWETYPDLKRALKPVECASLFSDTANDGILITFLACTPDATEAEKLFAYLETRKQALLRKEGANVFFSSLLILSELQWDGPFVKGSVRLTERGLMDLWNTRLIIQPGSAAELMNRATE